MLEGVLSLIGMLAAVGAVLAGIELLAALGDFIGDRLGTRWNRRS